MASSTPAEGGIRFASDSRRRVQSHASANWKRRLRQRLRNIRGKISLGRLAGVETVSRSSACLRCDRHERFASPAVRVPGDQIPAIAGVYETVRFDCPCAGAPAAVLIVEPNSFMSRGTRRRSQTRRSASTVGPRLCERHDEAVQRCHAMP